MSAKGIFILLILLVGVSGIAFFTFIPERKGTTNNAEPFNTLKEEINKITLSQGGNVLTLSHTVNGWRATTPTMNYPVKQRRIHELVTNLLTLRITDTKSESKKYLKKFKLDDSSQPITLAYFNQDTALASLKIGKEKRIKSQQNSLSGPSKTTGQYLKIEGIDGVSVSRQSFPSSMEPTEWFSGVLAKTELNELEKMELKLPHKKLVVEKITKTIEGTSGAGQKTETKWVPSGDLPNGKAFNAEGFERYMKYLHDVSRVGNAMPKSERALLKETPPFEIKVTAGSNSYHLYADVIKKQNINKEVDAWYIWDARYPDYVCKADEWIISDLFSPADDIFKLDEQKLDQQKIKTVTWTLPNKPTIKMTSNAGSWVVSGTSPLPTLSDTHQNNFIDTLTKLKLADYHKNVETPTTQRHLQVELTDGQVLDYKVHQEFKLNEGHLISITGAQDIYSIRDYDADKIFPKPHEIFNIKPDHLNEENRVGLKFKNFKIYKEGDKWNVDHNGQQREIDPASANNLYESLTAICESPYNPYSSGFAPQFNLEIEAKDMESISVRLSAEKDGIIRAQLSHLGGEFLVPSLVAKSLMKRESDFMQPAILPTLPPAE